MQEQYDEGVTTIPSKAIQKFPHLFKGSEKANLQKAARWYKNRAAIMAAEDMRSLTHRPIRNRANATSSFEIGRRRIAIKALSGRGRKTEKWTLHLYLELVDEFERLSSAGLKFSPKLLQLVAKRLLLELQETGTAELCNSKGTPLVQLLTMSWVQRFMEKHSIVGRRQCGKLMRSAVKQDFIHREVAYHLGEMHRGFRDGQMEEDLIDNMDETHFVVNVENGRTLGFIGDESVKYADVSSGGDSMTMVLRISGGRHARIEHPFMIFQNKDRNYPIRGVPDDVPGVSYRTGPKGWMDSRVFPQWLAESRAIQRDTHNRQRILFLDNCSGHVATGAQTDGLRKINYAMRFLPKNATDLCQPVDSFVIQKVKERWTELWEEKKMVMLNGPEWTQGTLVSGKLPNPGKSFFLHLASQAVRDVNGMRDENGLNYARKAMIRCGLSLDVNGQWRKEQLFPHLQMIIAEHRNHFNGEKVGL